MKNALFIIIIIICKSINAQTLELTKGKKHVYIYKGSNLTLELKDGNKYKGKIDTITYNSLTISSDIGTNNVLTSSINKIKKCGYLFSWGATHHIGKYCKTYKLSDYKTRLKIVRVE